MEEKKDILQKGKDNRVSMILWGLYCLFLLLSIVLIVKICVLQFGWEPDQDLVKYFQPKRYLQIEKPERGAIMDCNGKLLAITIPMYNINMDCTVRKEEFALAKTERKRDSLENDWKAKAKALSRELPKVLAKDGKDADYYYNLIISNRESDLKGRKNVPITKNIDHETYLKLLELPLFNEGRYKSGLIKTEIDMRKYPYGTLAGRVIGDVRINKQYPEESRYLGIEGKYDYILHGTEGSQWMKRTDRGSIVDKDSSIVEVVHGQDIRTTLDIDIQDIADRALRKYISEDESIQGGCVVVMEVKTGAVKAMVNLQKNSKGVLGENYNMAIGRPGEPGSVFKAVTLATLLEDGHVNLETEIPTNHGKMHDLKVNDDQYIKDFERKHWTDRISVLDGFKISSNYVFRRLTLDYYKENPQGFIHRLYDYHLNDSFEFDLTEKGATRSRIQDSDSKYYLASAAIGYSIMQTPLNMVTFYNAIANNGKMMKPYLIEAFEVDGEPVREFGPQILSGSIFSKATADTLTRALKTVTLEGTATRLKNAKCTVAGKTGTARTVLDADENPQKNDAYVSVDGERKYQATFVGFFPADEPKYTAIVVAYTYLTKGSVYGGGIPARTFREIVDNLWSLDSSWGEDFQARAKVPEMRPEYIGTRKGSSIPVPDVKGMGLKDAIYAIENNGYRCQYEGIGHVVSQVPAAGKCYGKGETIKLVLK